MQTRFCGLQSYGRARRRRALIFRPEDEGVAISSFRIESGRAFATGVMTPGIIVSVDSFLTGEILRSGLHLTGDIVDVDRDRLPEK